MAGKATGAAVREPAPQDPPKPPGQAPTGGGAEPAPPAAAPPAGILAKITRGRVRKPQRTVLYGPEGIGKTTFGAGAPAPVLLPVESGSDHVDVERLPQPATFADLLATQRELRESPHDYKTLVVDTADAIEPLIWAAVIAEANASGQEKSVVRSIEQVGGGYGKGYVAALDKWRLWLKSLDLLREKRGMWIVIIAHSHVKTQKNPSGEDFDRFQIKINDKAAAALREWADDVLFATLDLQIKKGKGFARAKATGGQRIIYTSTNPAFEAKNRNSLPATLPLDFGDYLAAVEKHQPADPAILIAAINRCLETLKEPSFATWVAAELERKPSADRLARIRDRLAAKVDEKARAAQEAREVAGDPEIEGASPPTAPGGSACDVCGKPHANPVREEGGSLVGTCPNADSL